MQCSNACSLYRPMIFARKNMALGAVMKTIIALVEQTALKICSCIVEFYFTGVQYYKLIITFEQLLIFTTLDKAF